MKFSVVLSSIIALSQAAPIVITRMHTAPAVTDWQTFTTNTVTKIQTVAEAVNSPPPANTATSSTTPVETTAAAETSTPVETTSSVAPTTPVETSTQAEPTTSTSVTTTASPVAAAPQENTVTTSATPLAIPTTSEINVATTSSSTTPWTPTTISTSSSTTSSSSTTQWWTPETTTSSPTTTSSTSTYSTSSSTTATETATSSSTGSSDLDEFQTEILNEHNKKRDLHGVQHLEWNNTLATFAADYAANSFSCDNVQLIHSGGPYGENLAAGYTGGASPVDAWYDEISQYNYNDPGFSEATGHFTQLIWKASTQVGCAYVTCDNSWRQYTICEYSNSRGNIVGTDPSTGNNFFAENVVKPISG